MSARTPKHNENTLPVNIQEHLRKEEKMHPEATGALTSILTDLSRVAKSVSYLVNTAGICDSYGLTGRVNIQGENVIKLDDRANEQFKQILKSNPNVAGYASEEEDTIVAFNKDNRGKYVVWFDPLDGSSNFDTNISIGSIFSIYHRISPENQLIDENDFLQKGTSQVCAGYFLYGTSTMFVYTTGQGVFSFTLDPSVGEFVLPSAYSEIKTPESGKVYSLNEANINKWDPKVAEYLNSLKTRKENPCSARYVGSFVADFHRDLLKGGVYIYPEDSEHPNGKLRLNCELNPLAFIAEQAGGMATDGRNRILEIKPTTLHQRSPVAIGSKEDVLLFNQYLS